MSLRVSVLALGTFAIGTGTFVVTGLLDAVAGALSVSLGAAGYVITVFALSYAVGSPLLVAVTGRVARRRLLISALVLFALANVAAALAPSFSWLLGTRVLGALGAAVFTPVAGAVAAELAPPGHMGRALSIVLGGLSVSWVVGIPLGYIVGDAFGWRASFVLVAVLAALAASGVAALLPVVRLDPEGTLRERLAVARNGAVLQAVGITALGVAAGFVVLTYIRPLLEKLTGFGAGGIGALLFVFGLAAVGGTTLGGFVSDRFGYHRSVAPILVVLAASLLCFSLLSNARAASPFAIAGTTTALVCWSVVGFALIPLQQYRLIGIAPEEGNEVLALNASAIYLGQGAGSYVGILILGPGSLASLGWTGALCAALGLVLLAGGGRADRKKIVGQRPPRP